MTNTYNLVFEYKSQISREENIYSLIEQIKRIPLWDPKLLNYHQNQEQKSVLDRIPEIEVCFNHFGVVDYSDQHQKKYQNWFKELEDQTFWLDPKNQRSYILGCITGVVDGQIYIRWDYSKNLHKEETINQLTESFFELIQKNGNFI